MNIFYLEENVRMYSFSDPVDFGLKPTHISYTVMMAVRVVQNWKSYVTSSRQHFGFIFVQW